MPFASISIFFSKFKEKTYFYISPTYIFNNFQQTFYCFSIPFKFISNNITLFLQFKREITKYFIKPKLIWRFILESHGTFLKKKKKHSNREVVEDRFYIFTLQILEEKWFEEYVGDALIAIFFINLFYFFLFFI
jgi:hypothetical protein